ncbi:MAG: APC family permease [Armatimonadota bacterium]
MPYSLRRTLFGSPIATSRMAHERLGPVVGLAVFASDALSSVAYATEEILLALVLAGTSGLPFTTPVGIAIGLLILIVAFSYRQTILQYPNGGGAYIVAHDNLGENFGLVAGAALLIDYVLTVAVSVTAGVAAVISAFPGMEPYRVGLAIAVILLIAFVNLRGVRESGLIFAIPTYAFIISLLTLLVLGLGRIAVGNVPAPLLPGSLPVTQALTWFLVLRAFASGCAALTGIEAVANGVQAFREPSARNAVRVLTALAFLLLVMFIGITWLAHSFDVVPVHNETVVSQIAEHVFGRGPMYFIIQFATSVILFLAANTSFAGFPRLASLLASDGYLPRQLANLGDRLVFNNGILVLAGSAIVLVMIFGGVTHALIPLYAVGVFLAFTLSQGGMIVRWYRTRDTGWKFGLVINSIGALTTLIVLLIILLVKFTSGAWMVVILLPLLVFEFRAIHRHYLGVADLLRIDKIEKLPVHPTKVIVPVAGLHRGVLRALRFAAGLHTDTVAIHVAVDEEVGEKLKRQWAKLEVGVPLVVLDSPYRSLVGPLLDYVDEALAQSPDGFVAVVIPEFVPQHWRHAFMHNQSALLLEFALRSRPNAVLISIRYLLGQAAKEARQQREQELLHQAEEAKLQAAAAEAAAAPPAGEEPPPVEK